MSLPRSRHVASNILTGRILFYFISFRQVRRNAGYTSPHFVYVLKLNSTATLNLPKGLPGGQTVTYVVFWITCSVCNLIGLIEL